MRASSNTMPKKDRLPSPGEAGTKLMNIRLLFSVEVLDQRAAAPVYAGLPCHLVDQHL